MSFGFGIADGLTLIQLAWSTYEGAKQACSEHDDLTKEISTVCTVLGNLQAEVTNPDSLIYKANDNRRKELENYIGGCNRYLGRISAILMKFNSLSEVERSATQLWQKVRFGHGAIEDVSKIRQKITTYTTAISISLHLISQGSQGRMEKELDGQSGELKGIRESINLILAKLSPTQEGSVFTNYTHDDVTWWRTFRRNLVKSGYKSKTISRHKDLIQAYVKELDDKGVFDDTINYSCLSLDKYESVEDLMEIVELPGIPPPPVIATSVMAPPIVAPSISTPSITAPSVTEASITAPSVTTASITRTYAQSDTFKYQDLSFNMTEMAQKIVYLEEQLLHAINGGSVRPKGDEEQHVFQPSDPEDRNAGGDARPVSPMSDGAAEDTSKEELISVAEFLCMVENDFAQEGEDSLDKEGLEKARAEAFSILPIEEKKKAITLQDPSEKRYSFPYYLVMKWEGMKHLLEQAFLSIEGLGEQVTNGEYDLVNSDGAVIIPPLWETFVEPDVAITMEIRPAPDISTVPTPKVSFQDVIPRGHSPLRRPTTINKRSISGQKSSARSSATSSTSSNSSLKSTSKSRSFWGFPKTKRNRRSFPIRPPRPPPGWYLPPPYTSPPPPPQPPPRYTYSIPSRYHAKMWGSEERLENPREQKQSEPTLNKTNQTESMHEEPNGCESKTIFVGIRDFSYPIINDDGAPIFEME